MSRRASVFARQNPGKRRVRFPDEVMFEESIKESDGDAIMRMLRRTSIDIDIDRINMAGMTALHQAILDNNLVVVRLLLHHGARINKQDVDSWTPLHAAVANGHHQIAAYLLSKGADRQLLTDEGETALDLVDPEDTKMSELLTAEKLTPTDLSTLQQFDMAYNERRMSGLGVNRTKPEPAWFRRESLVCESEQRLSVRGSKDSLCGGVRLQVPERDTFSVLRARKGSMWVGGEGSRLVEEEEEDQQSKDKRTENIQISSKEKRIDNIHISGREKRTDNVLTSKSRKNTFNEVEEEENVAEKLQKWKMRRGALHVER